jgi:hypothetical protein
MIGQILPNNNKRYYSNFSPTFREVNTPSRAIAQLSTNQAGYGQQKIEALEHYIKQKPNNLPKLTRIVVILSVLGWGDNG